MIKWIVAIIYASVLWSYAVNKNEEIAKETEIPNSLQMRPKRTNFHIYMLIFALQFVIIPILHAIVFWLFVCLTCCCEIMDEYVPDDYRYES